MGRLLLEGQLMFVIVQDYIYTGGSGSFINHFPRMGKESAIEILMVKYLPDFKIDLYEKTGWLMSGAMPAYNFQFKDAWLGIFYWFLNICLLFVFVLFGFKSFINGRVVMAFIYFKLSWYSGWFLALGQNFLFKDRFWFLVIILAAIYMVVNTYSKRKILKV